MNKATVQYNAQTKEIEKVWARINESTSSVNQLIEVIKDVKPIQVEIDPIEVKEKRMLEIPLFDKHYGISDYEYYKPTQAKIMDKLLYRNWEEVLFIIGQDLLHTDNFKGQTANGTLIGKVDLVKAWNDAHKFYAPLIEQSLKQSKKVKIMYSVGNHDESISWAFVQFIKALYPSIEYDDSLKQLKVHTFGYNFIGVTHGDKKNTKKNIHNLFPTKFPIEWSKTRNREAHTGHLHTEKMNDVFGMLVRVLPTRNKTDEWHEENGFEGAHKRFMLFEYSEDNLESIHYV
jgi:UDP-2,3-diacylglucosamine pyrophosphatase LpxH